MRYFQCLFLIFFLTSSLFYTSSFAQQNFRSSFSDSLKHTKALEKLAIKPKLIELKETENEVAKIIYTLQEAGFLLANLDSLKSTNSLATAYFTLGNCFKWATLKKGNLDEVLVNRVGFNEKQYRNQIYRPKEIAKLLERILIEEENSGYPFAAVNLDSIEIREDTVSASIYLQVNKRCTIDSLIIKGTSQISRHYVYRLLGIRRGDTYNESRIKQISNRINGVPFLKEARTSEVYFSDKYTRLNVYIDSKKANRFDGVLGFLPNETTGKLLITGQATLKLSNSFNKGEVLDVDWQKLQAKTQNLKSRLQIPFLFRSPFGADLGFKLYKRDTLFTDVSQNVGFNYLVGLDSYFKLFFTNRTINLISTRGLENLTTLPPYVDISSQSYGIGFRTEKLDFRLNPRKGYVLDITVSAGKKQIRRNLKLNPVAYDKIQDQLKSTVYNGDVLAELYIPIQNRSTLVVGNRSAIFESEQLFQNELFRFGGLATLRGFDEESILASAYTISKLEYRFLLDRNSYLFAFANQAYYENKASKLTIHDTPYGFGAGITFETKPGIFSLTYALGKQFNNPISVRSAKVHFGIISTF